MKYDIEWSAGAVAEAEQLFEYLLAEWGETSVERFKDRIRSVLLQLETQARSGQPSTKRNNVRSLALSKRTRLFYLLENDRIVLLLFWDNKRNPNDLKY